MKKFFGLMAICGLSFFVSCKSENNKKDKTQGDTRTSTEITVQNSKGAATLDRKNGPYNGWNQQILSFLNTDTIPESFPKYSGETKKAYKIKCVKWGQEHMDMIKKSKRNEVWNFKTE